MERSTPFRNLFYSVLLACTALLWVVGGSACGKEQASPSIQRPELPGSAKVGDGQEGTTRVQSTTSLAQTSSSQGDRASTSATTPETSTQEPDPIEIQLLISVDWEGGTIREKNLEAIEGMRKQFPEIPLTHYLNAVYYVREGADKAQITKSIRRVIRDGDELGLHIHGWKSLFEAAGAEFRDGPNYLDLDTSRIGDVGYTVDIGAYPVEDLRKVIAFSVKTLEEQGLGRAKSFRSGGWMGRSNVLIALIREGFERDASSVATVHFDDEFFTESQWYRWLTQLWPNTRPDSQPYIKQVQDGDEMLSILEIPDNGALADYVKPSEMVKVYESCLAYKRTHPNEHVTMNFGFHDVNAYRYLERVTKGIEQLQARAKQDNVKLVPVTSETMKFSPARWSR